MKRTPQECPNGVRLTLFINQYFREYQNYNFYTAFTLLIQRLLPLSLPDDLVVEGGVVDSEEKAEDADAAETEDSDAASDDTKDAETTEEPEETEAADAE